MRIFFIFLFVAVCTFSIPAWGTNIDIRPIPDLPLKNIPPPSAPDISSLKGGWQVSLGSGVSYAPRYDGSANDHLRFLPLLEASYNDGKFFVSPLRGIGYNFSDEKLTQYGMRLTLGRGRAENVDSRLYGMGDIAYVPEAGLFFNRRLGFAYISSAITKGSHGSHAELGGGIGFPLSAADRLRLGVNLNWGDSQYTQTYFGITTEQAAASGNELTAYTSNSGIIDYALTTNWGHNYNKKWFSNAGCSYKWLTGSAKLSPLTQRSTMISFNFLLGYRF